MEIAYVVNGCPSGEVVGMALDKGVRHFLTYEEGEFHYFLIRNDSCERHVNLGSCYVEAEMDFRAEVKCFRVK